MKPSVNQKLRRADALKGRGDFERAAQIYQEILAAFPNNKRAKESLAQLRSSSERESLQQLEALYQRGRITELEKAANEFTQHFPNSPLGWNVLGIALGELSKFAASEEIFSKAVTIAPDFADAHYNLGIVLQKQGKHDQAAKSFQRTLQLQPDHPECHNNLGTIFQALGCTDEAVKYFERALQLEPGYTDAGENLADVLQILGDHDAALRTYRELISIVPKRSDIWEKIGRLSRERGEYAEAVESYHRAIGIDSDSADAHNGLGLTLRDLAKLEDSAESFRNAIRLNPENADAHNNLGTVLRAQGRLKEAVESYRLAVRHNSDHAHAYNNLGNALQEMNRFNDAETSYRNALRIEPNLAVVHYNLGNALQEQGRLDEAVVSFERCLRLDPENEAARGDKLQQQALMCDWSCVKEFQEHAETLGTRDLAVAPFAMLSKEDCPARQRRRSETWSRQFVTSQAIPAISDLGHKSVKLRVGYFSGDFHDHPVMHLMADVFAKHDKDRFEIVAYSYGGIKQGMMREALINQVDQFCDIHGYSDQAAIDLAREHRLDIAVDMNGYTGQSRSNLLAHRLAPLQINFPGFASTMGADFIDYIITDEISVPPEQQKHYSENLLYLPDCYLPYSTSLPVAETHTTKSDFGLPEESFVYCCFNNSYKVGPVEFDVWMRLLDKVEGSVLWLLKSNRWAEENLLTEASERGIDRKRLIFADRLPHAEHLARHKHADLFLDTFAFNGHATASDALWAGLPVITKTGQQLAARLATSILHAAGLRDLATESVEEYEALALALGKDRDRMSSIRSRLEENRSCCPLFDPVAYTRRLEAAYEKAFKRFSTDRSAEPIRI